MQAEAKALGEELISSKYERDSLFKGKRGSVRLCMRLQPKLRELAGPARASV